MSIRIAGGDVGLVKLQARIKQGFRDTVMFFKLLQKIGHRVPPCLSPHPLEYRLQRLFCRLLSREAGPIVKSPGKVVLGVNKISLRFIHPVRTPFHRSPTLTLAGKDHQPAPIVMVG